MPDASAQNACTTYNYVGTPFTNTEPPQNPLPGNITATATFTLPANYSGSPGGNVIASLAMNANSSAGGPINYVQTSGSPSQLTTCLQRGPLAFAQGAIIQWSLYLVRVVAGSCANAISSESISTNYVPDNNNNIDYFGVSVAGQQNTGGEETGDPGQWTVSSTNSPPVAVNETVGAAPSTPTLIDLTAGSACDVTSTKLITKPTKGTVTGFPGTTVTYTPVSGATGIDSFQFALKNGGGTSNTAIATITLTPFASNETANSLRYAPVAINLSAGAGGNPTSAALVGAPVGGTVTGFPGTTVTFTPTKKWNWSGQSMGFSFTVSNAIGTSNTATVTIWPTLVTSGTKSICSAVSSSSGSVSNAFAGAAAGLTGGTGKDLAIDVATDAFFAVFSDIVAKNDEVFGKEIDLTVGITQFAKKALKHFVNVNPLSIAMDVDSIFFSGVSLVSTACASDPPDPDYTTVARPIKIPVMKTGNSAVDQVEADYLDYMSLTVATVHAAERWQGATLANALTYERLQARAFKKYSAQRATVLQSLQEDNATIANALPPVAMSSFTGGAAAMAQAFNAQCGKPLPKDLNGALLGLNVSQQTIDQDVCAYAKSFNPITITTDFQTALSQPLQ